MPSSARHSTITCRRSGQAAEDRIAATQAQRLADTRTRLAGNLAAVEASLDALVVRAPVAGRLTNFTIQPGQMLKAGEQVGQIDSSGAWKLVADVDEYYLGRVAAGQKANLDYDGRTFALKVAKIYPQVKNGTFVVDLQFTGAEPAGVQRGQTLQAKLTLGDPAPALLIPNGAFYNDTGGTWVFVVAPDGRSAVKRTVRLGRRNADFIEVLDGLTPGEKVVTSPYTGLADKDRLAITRSS